MIRMTLVSLKFKLVQVPSSTILLKISQTQETKQILEIGFKMLKKILQADQSAPSSLRTLT
jgi:hypothetical protein